MIIGDIVKNVLFPYRGIGLVISRAVRASDPQWDHWNVLWPHGEVVVLEARRHSPHPERANDVSVVLDLMIHDIDLVIEMVTIILA